LGKGALTPALRSVHRAILVFVSVTAIVGIALTIAVPLLTGSVAVRKNTVILLSLDGFRHDYLDLYPNRYDRERWPYGYERRCMDGDVCDVAHRRAAWSCVECPLSPHSSPAAQPRR
jgi:hypothetical protein